MVEGVWCRERQRASERERRRARERVCERATVPEIEGDRDASFLKTKHGQVVGSALFAYIVGSISTVIQPEPLNSEPSVLIIVTVITI